MHRDDAAGGALGDRPLEVLVLVTVMMDNCMTMLAGMRMRVEVPVAISMVVKVNVNMIALQAS